MASLPKTAPAFNPYAHIDDVLDGIEKDYAMSNTILDKDETRTSTGLLSLDIVLRMKPCVSFGCLQGNVLIPFVDGTYHTIQEIVEHKIQGEVWSVNEISGKIEPKRITGWHYNGEERVSGNWIIIVTRTGELSLDSKLCTVTVTLDHKILTNVGWVKAKELTLNHTVVTMYERDSYTQKEHSEFAIIIDIVYYKEEDNGKTFGKYDITVEDNHNYLAGNPNNGIIVA